MLLLLCNSRLEVFPLPHICRSLLLHYLVLLEELGITPKCRPSICMPLVSEYSLGQQCESNHPAAFQSILLASVSTFTSLMRALPLTREVACKNCGSSALRRRPIGP